MFTGVDLAIDRGSRVVVLASTAPARRPCCACSPEPGSRRRSDRARHGLKIGYFAQEHDTLDNTATVWENIRHAARTPESRICGDCWALSCSAVRNSISPPEHSPAARRPDSHWPTWGIDGQRAAARRAHQQPDPASREQVLDAPRSYVGAVVLVTHDPGAAEALEPQRGAPADGTEDHRSEDYASLIEPA